MPRIDLYDEGTNVLHIERAEEHTQVSGTYEDDVVTIGVYLDQVDLFGLGGNDYLEAGDSEGVQDYVNWINGGAGADTMVGGNGKDIFIVNIRLDVVRDDTIGDEDWVYSDVSYTLPPGVENLSLQEPNQSGTGNALDNRIVAGNGHGIYRGLAGDDTFWAGIGDCTFIGGLGADIVEHHYYGVATYRYGRTIESDSRHGVDRIFDLEADNLIDLSRIDANAATPGSDDAFVFIGSAAFDADATGQVRYEVGAARATVIYVSTDADARPEMIIRLMRSELPTDSNFIF